ncbi:MAG: aconitate hydratase AcnA [Phycisphaerales bacterium]|nr:MAG: aconitate hydratase AcnA [Phycisphaerales bacterium]
MTYVSTPGGDVRIASLKALEARGLATLDRLPFSIRVLLESALRNVDAFTVTEDDVNTLANWSPAAAGKVEIPFKPARVLMQDFTGVPCIVDLAVMRDAMADLGGDPSKINPLIPIDLVIDHSVQVDSYASVDSLGINARIEFERNRQRYEFLRWGQKAFDGLRVVPPATGIVHQVNLEYLASVVATRDADGHKVAMPDSLVGTDSHTTMINGLGVVGWGVGGIEAEATMLGQPISMLLPEVVGFKLTGSLPEGATATDLVLTITEMLRKKGVVGKFVEYYGDGLASMRLADRATIANMSPEYGATMGFFPVDDETLRYLRLTARPESLVQLVERYCKEQNLFRTARTPDPQFCDTLELDMSTVEPSLAGPKRPQDRVPLSNMKSVWNQALTTTFNSSSAPGVRSVGRGGAAVAEKTLTDGDVVIAAITSCTNTSNPSVMIAAGLVAKRAAEKGLKVPEHVKTSLAPGSTVVTRYLDEAGLTPHLEKLGFHTVGYGCTTCIGNSGPLPEWVERAIHEDDLVVCSVLSGNRNFEGRIHASVKANYLASPPLVVAYALAGTVNVDLQNDPIGEGGDGRPVYLRDIWPSPQEVRDTIARVVTPRQFQEQYASVFTGNEQWNKITGGEGDRYPWDDHNTYIQKPPFFDGITLDVDDVREIRGARVLAMLGDSVTTDHISPAGSIKAASPAGKYLQERGVAPKDFNSYGSRRGNDRVMTRGTFANVRLRNLLAPGTEGGQTLHLPSGEAMSIFDASVRYRKDGVPTIVLAGKEYGTGSSRDWAAKGVYLLGVKAVIAESYERIHRSNLVFMGVLPLQFREGQSRQTLSLTGHETYDVLGLTNGLRARQELTVTATAADGSKKTFTVICRIDTPVEVDYYRNGGILQTVLRKLAR